MNNENQLVVDTYSSFIRGKATDRNGILNIHIKGKKVRVKEDGTFVSKNVKDQAAINGREQTLELQSDKIEG